MQITTANVDVLRQGWADAVNSLAPGVDELSSLLSERLDEAVLRDTLDEQSLLSIVEEAAGAARRLLPAGTGNALSRRLQRAVYEYLLSLDAVVPEETASANIVSITPLASMIGAEEIAELSGNQSPAGEPEAPPEEYAEPEPPVPDFADVIAEMDPLLAEEAVEHDPDELGYEEAGGESAETETEPVPDMTTAAAEPSARRGRFMMFRRNGTVAPMPDAALPDSPPPPPISESAATAPALGDFDEPPAPSFVAPRDGFHLTDHSDYEATEPPSIAAAEVEAPAEPDFEAPPQQRGERIRGASARGWRVRSLRMGRRDDDPAETTGEETAAADAEADAELEDEETPQEALFNNDPEAIDLRRQIDDRLRRRKCDDAASLMQRLSADFGGRPVADLGLDAGDRCRALGKTNAALSCYLAATRADPVYDEPLLRLADVCLDDRDVDLAVSYLERVARLHRLRGDHKGALRVYRKIATVAPNREDVLSVLMRAQATGRFDD